MKPYIANDLTSAPLHISFREEKIGSEIEYPLFLKNGKKVVLILLSSKKNHFKEKHLEEMRRIEIELTSLINKLENGLDRRGVILVGGKNFRDFIEESLKGKFKIYWLKRIEEILEVLKEGPIEFIFKECNLRCSKECKEIFFLSKENFIPIGLLRPFTFNHKEPRSFSSLICSPLPLSPIQENIRDIIKESKYHITSEKWQFANLPSLHIAFIQNYIIENYRNSNAKGISQHFNLSLSYLSRSFKSITGTNLKEFINKIKMCNSLFQLIDERPINKVASFAGYSDRFSFSRAFKRIFGVPPSQVKIK